MGHIDKTTTFCKEQYRRHGTNAVIFCLLTALSQVKLKKVLLAFGFAFSSLTLIAPTPSKAEGGCPKGFFPIGGGYCRNISCGGPPLDQDAENTLQKYKKACGYGAWYAHWGNQTIPMR